MKHFLTRIFTRLCKARASCVALALLCSTLLLGTSGLAQAGAEIGKPAPDFVLQDSAGDLISLKDFRGRPLILHFWASWCPYCKKLQPGLEALANANASKGVALLGISFRENAGVDPQAELRKRGHSFKTLVDGEEVAEMYGVRGTPTTVFIDRSGRIQGMTHSSDPNDIVLKRLATAIAD